MVTTYNRTAAFLEYSRGSSLEDIAMSLAIPLNHLRRWAREDRWASLAATVPTKPELPAATSGQLQRIQENREKNLVLAQGLQEELVSTVTKLRNGQLKCTKITSKGVKVEYDPGVTELKEIAICAREVAELSYRALGDVVSSSKSASAGSESSGQNITIVLPSLIAAPRQERAYDVDAEVVTMKRPICLEVPVEESTSGRDNASHSEQEGYEGQEEGATTDVLLPTEVADRPGTP